MRYSIIAKLRGPLAEAVAVEWTDHESPEGSAAGWEPCVRLQSGDWRLYSYGATEGRARHWFTPGQVVGNFGLRYRLTAAGPWSEISESRKALAIVADPEHVPAALGAADWAPVEEAGATGVFVLHGAAAAAVAVEWIHAGDQEQSWQPGVSLGDGRWRLARVGGSDLPEGLEGEPLAIRYRLVAEGAWSPVSLDAKVVVPALPDLPLLLEALVLAGAGKIGAELTVTPGLWSGNPVLSVQWLRDGEAISGATAEVYVPVPADDERDLTCDVTATNAAGSTVATTTAIRVTYVAPSAKGELPEVTFDEGTGPQEVAAAGDFIGENLSFSVDGAGATIDPATGVVQIPTDAPIPGEMVTVNASNSGGEATSSFAVTVEAAESDVVFALDADDIEIVRTEWRPATQSTWFTPVVRFPGLAGVTVDAIEWTTGVDPVPEHHFEVVRETGTPGEFALYMRNPANNAPEASPRVDFSVWRAGEARTEVLRFRWRRSADGPWSPLSVSRSVVAPGSVLPPVPVLPVLLLAPVLAGAGKIAAELTVAPGLWSGDPALTLQWCRDGEAISGATGGAYVPGPADDGRNLTCAVTATNAAGSTVSTTAAVRVTYVAPSAKGELLEEIFDEDTGPQEVAAAGDFIGENLSFSVDGAGATIDPATGVVQIPTDTPISGEIVTVTASNSGGEATSSFMVTVEAAESGEEDAVFALEAEDVEIVRTEWRPATQSTWFTPVVRFPGLAGVTVDAIEWTTGVDPVPEHHFEVVRETGTAGEFALYMRNPANNAPEASPRVDFSVWRSGEARTEVLRFRWRRSADGPWSPLSVAQSVVAPALPEAPTPPVSSEEPPWRSLFRRAAHHLRETPSLPAHYSGGRYGGEGYQHLQTGAWSGDGSAYYAGQDMGLVRKSVSVEGRRPGEVWHTPPGVGLRGLGCMTIAVDPADPDVVLALTSMNYANLHEPSSLLMEGLYRTANGGVTWNRVVAPVALVQYSRQFYFNLSPYPATGGSASTRRWLFVHLNRVEGGQGSVWRSTNGGVSWVEIAKLTQSTYGRINGIFRTPNNYQNLYMCSQNGVFYSANEGVTWARPSGWPARFSSDCRSMWIDPDNYQHMIVSVAGGDSANYGVWETTNNGASWTRIFSTYATACIAVGAKNASNQRLIVVMPSGDLSTSLPRIRRFDGSWVTATHDQYDPDSWSHQGMTGASTNLMHVVAHPTDPEMFILHGRPGPFYPVPGTQATHWRTCEGYFSSEYHALGVNRSNHLQMAFASLDQLVVGSLDGFATAYQWTLSQAQKDAISTSSKRARGITWLPDPWPAGAPAPASSSVPGRLVLAAGESGQRSSALFIQNKSGRTNASSTSGWSGFSGTEAQGGGAVSNRNFVEHDPANPNHVYAGRNRSTDGGTTWIATGSNFPIVAMSKLNGATVWGMSSGSAGDNQILRKSTDRGATWTLIRDLGFTNEDSGYTGLVYTFGGTDNVLLMAAGNRFNMSWPQPRIYNVSEDAFYTINCAPFFNGEPWRGFRSAAVCRHAPRWAVLNFECSGGPQCFLVRFTADYKNQESITDITYNLPRVQGALKIHNHEGTGDWIFSGSNGTFVYPAPDDWRHADPAMQANHRALFKSAARSIDNGWRALL